MRQGLGAIVGLVGLAALVAACGGSGGGQSGGGSQSLDQRVEKLCQENNLEGSPQLIEPNYTTAQLDIRDKRRELGRLLFFDHALAASSRRRAPPVITPPFSSATRGTSRGASSAISCRR
jgi:hypothetical protein